MKRFFTRRMLVFAAVLVLCAVTLTGYLTGSGAMASGTDDALVSEALDLKHTLRFNANGKFKIVIFSDIQDWGSMKSDTLDYMNEILDTEQPDLVLLGGDNHSGTTATQATMQAYLNVMAAPMETRHIPWAQVYGNHVEGGYEFTNGFSKEAQQAIFEAFPYNLSKSGNVYGVGNYVLPVLASGTSDKIAFNVFMLDSHSYLYHIQPTLEKRAILTRPVYSGNIYDVIHFDQIRWYWKTSEALEVYNGSKIAAMMLFHIPLYEWNYIVKNPTKTGMTGSQGEAVCAPEMNSGLFQALYERGDVKGVFCGHDHVNDFCGKYMGITLGYCPTIGSLAYFGEDNRGARIIEVDESDAFNFTTRMVYVKDLQE